MPEFDLGDINRAGGLPALCSTPRDRKTGREKRNREEIGTGATRGFYFFAASPLSSASDKTAMIRRLGTGLKRYQNSKNRIDGSIYRQLSLRDRH